jgi:hypothetical protein
MIKIEDRDVFLSSSEGYDLETPRRCKFRGWLTSNYRDDLMLVSIEPPVIGQKYGLGGSDIDEVVIASRHKGESLRNVARLPISVHVARLREPLAPGQRTIDEATLVSIAWADVYGSEEEALLKGM